MSGNQCRSLSAVADAAMLVERLPGSADRVTRIEAHQTCADWHPRTSAGTGLDRKLCRIHDRCIRRPSSIHCEKRTPATGRAGFLLPGPYLWWKPVRRVRIGIELL